MLVVKGDPEGEGGDDRESRDLLKGEAGAADLEDAEGNSWFIRESSSSS